MLIHLVVPLRLVAREQRRDRYAYNALGTSDAIRNLSLA